MVPNVRSPAKQGLVSGDDPFVRKEVAWSLHGVKISLRTAHDLFSGHDIDLGSRLLVRTLAGHPYRRLLDLGCGYGAIGLALKAMRPDATVHLADRDALAVEFARENADLNRFTDVLSYGSLDYDAVSETDFDLVACNVPAKAGLPAIRQILLGASNYLSAGGMVAVVIVAPLHDEVVRILASAGVVVLHTTRGRTHTVLHYRFTDDYRFALDKAVYDRGQVVHDLRLDKAIVTTVYGLPEFDSPSFASDLGVRVIQGLESMGPNAIFHNSGQGHLPVVAWKLHRPDRIVLVDRDLLGMTVTRDNLVRNGCPPGRVEILHAGRVTSVGNPNTVVLPLRKKESWPVAAQRIGESLTSLGRRGDLILVGSSTQVTRALELFGNTAGTRVGERLRAHGESAVAIGVHDDGSRS